MTSVTEEMIEALKPCPFCGGAPEMQPWHGGAPTKVLVSCSQGEYGDEYGGCSVSPMVTGETPAEAIAAWNRRAALEAALSASPAAQTEPVAWTGDDHKAALKRLETLAEQIEAYESVHFPIDPPTPEQAAAFRAEQEGWRDIASVPKDGRHVLVCDYRRPGDPPFTAHWFDGALHLSVNALADYSTHGCASLTHWKPLDHPATPSAPQPTEPVAWQAIGDGIDPSKAVTADPATAEYWRKTGSQLRPLYASPVAQQRDEVIEECAKLVETKAAAQSEFQKSAYNRGDDIGGHGHWKAHCELLTAAAAIRALSPERKDQSHV